MADHDVEPASKALAAQETFTFTEHDLDLFRQDLQGYCRTTEYLEAIKERQRECRDAAAYNYAAQVCCSATDPVLVTAGVCMWQVRA